MLAAGIIVDAIFKTTTVPCCHRGQVFSLLRFHNPKMTVLVCECERGLSLLRA